MPKEYQLKALHYAYSGTPESCSLFTITLYKAFSRYKTFILSNGKLMSYAARAASNNYFSYMYMDRLVHKEDLSIFLFISLRPKLSQLNKKTKPLGNSLIEPTNDLHSQLSDLIHL